MSKSIQEAMQKYATEYALVDKQREELIILSRPMIKAAKQAIYALHRNAHAEAQTLFAQAEKDFLQAVEVAGSVTAALEIGAVRASVEEFLEAKAYQWILEQKTIPAKEDIAHPEIPLELYLQALCDTAGELVRYAVQSATEKQFTTVKEIKQLVEELQGYFLLFDLRGGELRKKSDSLRHHLNKLETLVYEVSLRE